MSGHRYAIGQYVKVRQISIYGVRLSATLKITWHDPFYRYFHGSDSRGEIHRFEYDDIVEES